VSSGRICILSLAPVHRDGRVLRQIDCAARHHQVLVVGWGRLDRARRNVRMEAIEPWRFSPASRLVQAALMLAGRGSPWFWERWYWRKPDHRRALCALREWPCDVIHVNEAIALPIAVAAAAESGARVLFDAHEYSPAHRANNAWWRLLAMPLYTHIIRAYAHRADVMTTVAPGIAREYRRVFGLQPDVILNVPHYVPMPLRPPQPDRLGLVHHGVAVRERMLQKMIDVVARTDERFALTFMLLEDRPGTIGRLRLAADELAPGRVTFVDPVPPWRIVETIHRHDIGLFLLPPVNTSYAMALPNKFFEFLMAGLAVAIGPSPEMATICRRHDVGLVAGDFEPATLAAMLNALSAEQVGAMKARALEAAKTYNFDVEARKLLALYRHLLHAPSAPPSAVPPAPGSAPESP